MLSRSRRRSILFAFETHFRRNRERHRTGGGMASLSGGIRSPSGASAPSDVPQTGRSGGGSGSPSAKTRQATFSGRGNRERSPSSIRSARGTDVGSARCHRRWFRAPARCRSETGAPTWFLLGGVRAVAALRAACRPEVGVPSRPRASTLGGMGVSPAVPAMRVCVIGAGFALPRDAGRRPALRCCAICTGGDTWFRPALRGCAGRRSALLAVPALLLGRRCVPSAA